MIELKLKEFSWISKLMTMIKYDYYFALLSEQYKMIKEISKKSIIIVYSKCRLLIHKLKFKYYFYSDSNYFIHFL